MSIAEASQRGGPTWLADGSGRAAAADDPDADDPVQVALGYRAHATCGGTSPASQTGRKGPLAGSGHTAHHLTTSAGTLAITPMRCRPLPAAMLGALLALAPVQVASAQESTAVFDEAQRQEVEAIIADYILDNPEIVYRALQVLQEREEAAEAERARLALESHRNALERDSNSAVGGNPSGDVTVVEFFDYQCPYCKRVAPDVERLIESDSNVRFVYKEWPILGPPSVFAARAALAAREQDRYLEFHDRVMSLEKVTEAEIIAVARDLDLDIDRLRRDMAAPEVDQHIEQTMQLAQALGINGTPAFVIGDRIVPGAASLESLRGMVGAARAREGSAE